MLAMTAKRPPRMPRILVLARSIAIEVTGESEGKREQPVLTAAEIRYPVLVEYEHRTGKPTEGELISGLLRPLMREWHSALHRRA
jgi:hypothetical protein